MDTSFHLVTASLQMPVPLFQCRLDPVDDHLLESQCLLGLPGIGCRGFWFLFLVGFVNVKGTAFGFVSPILNVTQVIVSLPLMHVFFEHTLRCLRLHRSYVPRLVCFCEQCDWLAQGAQPRKTFCPRQYSLCLGRAWGLVSRFIRIRCRDHFLCQLTAGRRCVVLWALCALRLSS